MSSKIKAALLGFAVMVSAPFAMANTYTNANVEAAVTNATTMIQGDAMTAVGAAGAAVIGVVLLIALFRWIRRTF